VVGAWLAYAAERFGIELYAFVVLSNHVHLLLRAPQGNLADFMAYWQGNVAKGGQRAAWPSWSAVAAALQRGAGARLRGAAGPGGLCAGQSGAGALGRAPGAVAGAVIPNPG
jgi:hypothetical protein